MAFAYDGAWAEYTVAQAVGLTRIPDNVPLEQAAILADAVSTPFGAVVRTGKVGIGESVGVWGVGGVGTHIVQLARLVGAVPIIAVDIKPAVLDRALEVGADYAFDARDDRTAGKIAEVTGGSKLDVAFDAVGPEVDVRAGARQSDRRRPARRGRNERRGSDRWTDQHVRPVTQKQVLGHLGYQNVDIETLADLVSAGAWTCRARSARSSPLEDVAMGIEKLERHDGNPIRILVQP